MKRLIYIILNFKTYHDTIKVSEEIYPFLEEEDYILIIDNNSPNESSKELHRVFDGNAKVEVIDSPENGGYAKGNNYGLRYAQKYNPEYVCIINNDVHFTKETISKLIDIYPMLEKPALISPIQVLPGNKMPFFYEMKLPTLLSDIRSNTIFFKPPQHKYYTNTNMSNVQKVGYIPGAFIFVKFSTFEGLGFFDERTFLFCEERFTGKAVADAGMNNYVITNLKYLHEHSKTIKNEASDKMQRNLIHKGRILYHDNYSKYPQIARFLLNLVFYIHELEIKLSLLLKR